MLGLGMFSPLGSIECFQVEEGFEVSHPLVGPPLIVQSGKPVKKGSKIYLTKPDYQRLKTHPSIKDLRA